MMATPLDALERRLADAPVGAVARRRCTSRPTTTRLGRARGRAVRAAARGARGRGRGERLDPDRRPAASTPTATRSARFARDLSDRLGAVVVALALEHGAVVRFRLYESGRMVDEYLSVPTLLRRAAEGRRARARGEPDARRAAHRRRPRRGAAGRAHGAVAGRAAAGRGAVRRDRADRWGSSREARRRARVPLLRPRPDRPRREGRSTYETVEIDLAQPARRGSTS